MSIAYSVRSLTVSVLYPMRSVGEVLNLPSLGHEPV